MNRSKTLGIGAMFILLVVSVIFLPKIVRYINRMEPHFVISGFQNQEDKMPENGVEDIPAIGKASKLPTYRPDPNTNYLCRSPNEDGQPCPEGYFCDGTTQACIPNYVGGEVPSVGYFS